MRLRKGNEFDKTIFGAARPQKRACRAALCGACGCGSAVSTVNI